MMAQPSLQIIWEDKDLVAINKPAGMVSESHFADHFSAENMVEAHYRALKKHPNAKVYVRAVHRLDRPVSGVLLLARNKAALTATMALFEQRAVKKQYIGVVKGSMPTPEGKLEHYVKRDATGKKAVVTTKADSEGNYCALRYKVLEYKDGYSRLLLKPEMGRFHQIRVQLSAIGHPLEGDIAYGGNYWEKDAIKLHAHSLSLKHPVTGEALELVCEVPEQF